jgi:hypothetical protein
LEATLITPTAPTEMKGSVSESSPEMSSKVFGDGLAELADAFDRAAGFFDRHDVRAILGEAGYHGHADLHAAASGNAVENDRELGSFAMARKWR